MGVSPAHLASGVKIERIKHLSRGIYQNTDYKTSPKHFRWEELMEAAHWVQRGVFASFPRWLITPSPIKSLDNTGWRYLTEPLLKEGPM
jgi:hypothetical protein